MTDPLNVILSKRDIDELRHEFKGGVDIPPYDPDHPPPANKVEWILAALSQDHASQAERRVRASSFTRSEEFSIAYSLNKRTSPTAGASLLKYFGPDAQPRPDL